MYYVSYVVLSSIMCRFSCSCLGVDVRCAMCPVGVVVVVSLSLSLPLSFNPKPKPRP